jgi:hypothetical protein
LQGHQTGGGRGQDFDGLAAAAGRFEGRAEFLASDRVVDFAGGGAVNGRFGGNGAGREHAERAGGAPELDRRVIVSIDRFAENSDRILAGAGQNGLAGVEFGAAIGGRAARADLEGFPARVILYVGHFYGLLCGGCLQGMGFVRCGSWLVFFGA